MSYTDLTTDLVSLIQQKSGIDLVKSSNHFKFGDEYWGPCPFCGTGENRFHVWPQGDRPHYWCRMCGREGSPPWFLVSFLGISFSEACEELGIEREDQEEYRPPTVAEQLEKNAPPPKAWQEAGMLLVEQAERYLWQSTSVEAREALVYLRKRGLTDETIKRARIGYCPLMPNGRWYMRSFEQWGIDEAMLTPAGREKGGVRVPDGIIIPWFEGERLWKIAVKRPGEKMDYGQIMGSCEGMYNIDSIQHGKPAMIVEAEFCALSVMQEAGDLVSCVATGSTTRGRAGRWLGDLALSSFVLQAFDDDEGGEEGARYWTRALPHVTRWQPWMFKDPNDMLQHQDELQEQAKTTLRGWVEQGLWAARLEPLYDHEPSPLPPVLPAYEKPDYQHYIDVQAHYERLCATERVNTPDGPGEIWDSHQLRVHIERAMVRVTLDHLIGAPAPHGATRLFPPEVLEPILSIEQQAF